MTLRGLVIALVQFIPFWFVVAALTGWTVWNWRWWVLFVMTGYVAAIEKWASRDRE